jgi:beta-lactamase regulating signal transducer with metallopeptidase domain
MADRFQILISLLGDDVSVRWLITLLHFLWQGVVVGVVVAIVAGLLHRASARARYALYSASLLSLPVCVVVTFCVVDLPVCLQSGSQLESPANVPVKSSALRSQAETAAASDSPASDPSVVRNAATMKAVAGGNSQSALHSLLAMLSRAAPWIAATYVVGVAFFLLRLSTAFWNGHCLRTRTLRVTDAKLLMLIADQSHRVKLKCVPVVAYCERVAVPTVLGVLRPMVLLPVPLMTGLTPDEFTAIIRHELAHIRRYDLWMNLLQRVIESLLFFHPVVWFISRRLNAEREVCCDDLVVSSGYAPMHYAGALLRMAELCAISRQSVALALAVSGNKTSLLEKRIERLMNWGNAPRLQLTRAGIAFLLMALVSLIVVSGIARACVQAQARATAPVKETRMESVSLNTPEPLHDAMRPALESDSNANTKPSEATSQSNLPSARPAATENSVKPTEDVLRSPEPKLTVESPQLLYLTWQKDGIDSTSKPIPHTLWDLDGKILSDPLNDEVLKKVGSFNVANRREGELPPLVLVFKVDPQITNCPVLPVVVTANGKIDSGMTARSKPTNGMNVSAATPHTDVMREWPAHISLEIKYPIENITTIKTLTDISDDPVEIAPGIQWYLDSTRARDGSVAGPLSEANGKTAAVLQTSEDLADPLVSYDVRVYLRGIAAPLSSLYKTTIEPNGKLHEIDVSQAFNGKNAIDRVEIIRQRYAVRRIDNVPVRVDILPKTDDAKQPQKSNLSSSKF